MKIYSNGKFSVFSFNSNNNKASEPIEITPDCKQAMIGANSKSPEKIVLEEINVLHFTEGNEISRQTVPNVVFYRKAKSFKMCDEVIDIKQITI